MTVPTQTAKTSRRGCGSCLIRLMIPVALLAGCLVCLLLSPLLLRAAGLIEPSAEELYSGAPDPVAGAMVDNVLKDSGIEGAKSYVLPIKGRGDKLAVVTFGSSVKFTPKGPAEEEGAIMGALMGLADVNASGANIGRTVASFQDKDGKPFLSFTAAQADIEAYARKVITRAEFLARVDADLSGLMDVDRLQAMATSLEGEDLPEFSQQDAEFAAEAAVEWVVGKKLVTSNCPAPYNGPGCELSPNVAEIARWQASQNDLLGFGLGLAGVRTVDDEAATALRAAQVAATLAEADTLADEGLRERNFDKIDRAVSLRPDDWSLHDRQAAFLYTEGDEDAARQALDEANDLVNRHIEAGGDCQTLQRNLLENRRRAFSQAAELNPGNRSLQDQLAQTQSTLAALENNQAGSPCR